MPRDRIGLLAGNGAGKSTLVRALASGSTFLNGERVLSKDTKIGYFAQYQLEFPVVTCIELDEAIMIIEDDLPLDERFADALEIVATRTAKVGYIRLPTDT